VRRIKVLIDRKGKIIVDAEGFVGPVCVKEVDKLLSSLKELGLDLDIEEHKLKPEFYQRVEIRKEVKVGE